MLFLTFQIGKDRYAIEAQRVIEVLPLLELKIIPRAPSGVAGLFNYRGRPVPAVDLSELALGQPSGHRMSTRIILTHYHDASGKDRVVGLIAERATDTIRRDRNDFVDSGVKVGPAPYLGPVLVNGPEVIQLVEDQGLLPHQVRDAIFCDAEWQAA